MRRDEFIATVQAISNREHPFPSNELAITGLMRYACEMVAMKAESPILMTNDTSRELIRMTTDENGVEIGIARPIQPLNDEDTIDLDEQLVFAAIEYFVSFLSIEKYQFHNARAQAIIDNFNSAMENVKQNYIEDLAIVGLVDV